jgi:glycosyltransferase involved in cell wall biosynthesis
MKYKKLVIISHTEHYLDENNEVVGWGPTINEINFLADYFEEIVHIACLYDHRAPLSSNIYTIKSIKFIPIPPFGGNKFIDKLGIILKIPKILKTISEQIQGASHVQLRLPTGIGVFLLPYFSWFKVRTFVFWVKYAGNWAEENPPLGYRFQRWFLVNNFAKCKVTINGFWPNQPEHCISFENPCLTDSQLAYGKVVSELKEYKKPFRFVFVGRLEDAKGVQRIIDAFKYVDLNDVESLDIIGDGQKKNHYINDSIYLGDKVHFHGSLNTNDVHYYLSKAHFLLLPSKGEGFPKVVAEAACYGTIPVVTNVGSIGHYVNCEIGYLCDQYNIDDLFKKEVIHVLNETHGILKQKNISALSLAEKFSFENYYNKLKKIIID